MKSHFKFNRQEQSGILFLLFVVIVLQCLYFFFKYTNISKNDSAVVVDSVEQLLIDSLKQVAKAKDSIVPYTFNPNFITDYKGYTLGMSVIEIDRLHRYRAQGKFVNSGKEFQEVTRISDGLLGKLQDRFRFPEWKQQKKWSVSKNSKKIVVVADINLAEEEDFKTVNGIGVKLSARIIKFRDRLGGFLDAQQLYDVYGLDKEVADRAMQRFTVKSFPKIKKININGASVNELSSLLYISYELAVNIVDYRSRNGSFTSFEQLANVTGFPTTKLHRIALYLSL